MRREKRKQREAIEKIKLGVQHQEELERQNVIPDVTKGKHTIYTDEGDLLSAASRTLSSMSAVS